MEGEELSEKKLLLAKRSQEQLQEILHRKQSLSLNLKRSLPASTDDKSSRSEEMVSTSDIKSFQDACNRKLKIATALSLINQDLPSSIDTADTFHTAAADSPQYPGLENRNEMKDSETFFDDDANSDADLDFQTSNNEIQLFGQDVDDTISNSTATTEAMSQIEKNSLHSEDHQDLEKCSVDCELTGKEKYLNADDSLIDENEDMKTINQRIVRQRLLVMKCMESSSPSNKELNRQIDILQDLRRQQIELEVSLLEQRKRNLGTKEKILEEVYNDEMKAGSEFCNFDGSINSHANVSNASTTMDSNMFKGKESITDEDESASRLTTAKVPQTRGYSSVYLTVISLEFIYLN